MRYKSSHILIKLFRLALAPHQERVGRLQMHLTDSVSNLFTAMKTATLEMNGTRRFVKVE
jgi:hypothetical protein